MAFIIDKYCLRLEIRNIGKSLYPYFLLRRTLREKAPYYATEVAKLEKELAFHYWQFEWELLASLVRPQAIFRPAGLFLLPILACGNTHTMVSIHLPYPSLPDKAP